MKNIHQYKGIEELHKIQLSADEKQHMLGRIHSHMNAHPMPAKKTWYAWLIIPRYQLVRVGFAVFILAMSGGVVLAAEHALPGDILYPVKLNVNEKVEGVFKTTPAAKAAWQEQQAVRRLKEAETLVDQGKLDDSKRAQIEKEFSKNVKAFVKANEGREEIKKGFETRVAAQLKKNKRKRSFSF